MSGLTCSNVSCNGDGCGDCINGEQRCLSNASGPDKLQTCVGGLWNAGTSCPTEQPNAYGMCANSYECGSDYKCVSEDYEKYPSNQICYLHVSLSVMPYFEYCGAGSDFACTGQEPYHTEWCSTIMSDPHGSGCVWVK